MKKTFKKFIVGVVSTTMLLATLTISAGATEETLLISENPEATETTETATDEAVPTSETEDVLLTTETTTEAEETEEEAFVVPTEVDKDGVYHARIGVQIEGTTWVQRLGYFEGGNQYNEGDLVLHEGTYGKDDFVEHAAVYEDVEITGNGTYTVSISGMDLYDDNIDFTQVQVATDILNDGTITFSDIVFKVGDRTIFKTDEAFIDTDKYAQPYACIVLINHWRNNLKDYEDYAECVPADGETVSVTFTVSGFNYDKDAPAEEVTETAETTTETAAATPADSAAATEEKSTGLSAGTIIGIVIAAVVVIAVVVVIVLKKKKNPNA